MTVSALIHLNFTGDARQALEFYHSVFGGQLMIGTYGEGGVPQDSPDSDQVRFSPLAQDSPDADHVAFGMIAGDNGFRLAAYDVFGGDRWWCCRIVGRVQTPCRWAHPHGVAVRSAQRRDP